MPADDPTPTILGTLKRLSEVLSAPSPVVPRYSSIGALVSLLRSRLPLLGDHAEILDTARNTLLQFLTCTMIEHGTSDSAAGLWKELLRLDACLVPSFIDLHPFRCEMPTLQPLERLASEDEIEALSHVRQIIKYLCSPSGGLAGGHVLCGIGYFGWRTLRIKTIFVLGVNPRYVRRSFPSADMPIIELRGRLMVGADTTSRIIREKKHIYDRIHTLRLREQLLDGIRGVKGCFEEPPLFLGQSIGGSAMNGDMGSFCCHLTHKDSVPDRYYGLTACHVITPAPLHPPSEVVSPAPLAKLAARTPELRQLEGCDLSAAIEMIQEWDGVVGRPVDYEIGVDGAGWRVDWALLELDTEKQAKNEFYNELDVMCSILNPVHDLRVLASRDPRFGEIVIRVGAQTGAETGVVQGEDVYAFFMEPAASAPEIAGGKPADKANTVECRLRPIWPTRHKLPDCGVGDLGSPVFGKEETGGLAFLGMTVALVCGGTVTGHFPLIVPQSVLFRQLKEKTGVRWNVCGVRER